jgi:hypothetical protein
MTEGVRPAGRTNKKANPKIGLIAGIAGAPGAIRTPDPLVRSQILYPTELRARCKKTKRPTQRLV